MLFEEFHVRFLAKIKDTEKDAQNAINVYQEALRVYRVEKYPVEHDKIQVNVENSYLSSYLYF